MIFRKLSLCGSFQNIVVAEGPLRVKEAREMETFTVGRLCHRTDEEAAG
jgi:hypothetical protein